MRMKNMVKKLKKRLSERKGFSLTELLFSILILMLSTTIIIQCFNLGIGNVVRETRASEAQLLCSALSSSLQNELTYARDIKITDGKLDTYFSSSRRMGSNSKIIIDSGEIKIQSGSDIYPLVAGTNYVAQVKSSDDVTESRKGVSGGTYFLAASLDGGAIQWDSSKKVFNVTIWVDDASKATPITDATIAEKSALAYAHFSVKPLAGVTE